MALSGVLSRAGWNSQQEDNFSHNVNSCALHIEARCGEEAAKTRICSVCSLSPPLMNLFVTPHYLARILLYSRSFWSYLFWKI